MLLLRGMITLLALAASAVLGLSPDQRAQWCSGTVPLNDSMNLAALPLAHLVGEAVAGSHAAHRSLPLFAQQLESGRVHVVWSGRPVTENYGTAQVCGLLTGMGRFEFHWRQKVLQIA